MKRNNQIRLAGFISVMKIPLSTVCTLFLLLALALPATGCRKHNLKTTAATSLQRPVLITPNLEVAKVRKGMSRAEVEKLMGQPRSKDGAISYYKGMWVMFDTNQIVFNVKCVWAFPGTTSEGIGIGSTTNQLLAAYGHPDELKRFSDGEDWWYANLLINFWVQRGKVTSFNVHF